MKKLLIIIGLLVFAGCSQPVAETPTRYTVDKPAYERIMREERVCILKVLSVIYPYSYAGYKGDHDNTMPRDRLRSEVADCEGASFERLNYKRHAFYVWNDGTDPSPFEEFQLCTFGLASPMWDFPEETTYEDFHRSVNSCVSSFPKEFIIR